MGALLLGAGVLALLLPVVNAESGGLGRLGWLFGVAALLLTAFAWWEARTAPRGRQPLLPRSLFRVAGLSAGAAIGGVYLIGFTGIWLVLAMFFQHGLGHTPLRSGLAVTPFALGMAAAAAIAGRLVPRFGRWFTVIGLATTVVGLLATALMLPHAAVAATAWKVATPLLIAGFGGGTVTSPNLTLTLQNVPLGMAGAAGGALQTAQRIGSRHRLRSAGHHLLAPAQPRCRRVRARHGHLTHPAVRRRLHGAGAIAGHRGPDPPPDPIR